MDEQSCEALVGRLKRKMREGKMKRKSEKDNKRIKDGKSWGKGRKREVSFQSYAR